MDDPRLFLTDRLEIVEYGRANRSVKPAASRAKKETGNPPMPRPKSFDPDRVLDTAMRVFWERGYASTSVSELTDAVGINKFSLYSTFGDKRAVFVTCLDRYSAQVVSALLSDLEAADAGLDEIRAYFEMIVYGATHPQECHGCLMTNTAAELAPRDPEIRRKVRKHFGRMRGAFRRALDNAVERGELVPKASTDLLARHLVASSQSIAVAARTKPSGDEFRGYVAWLIESLGTTA